MLPGEIEVLFENWITVLMQFEGGLKATLGKGNTVTGVTTESAQPWLLKAFNFT